MTTPEPGQVWYLVYYWAMPAERALEFAALESLLAEAVAWMANLRPSAEQTTGASNADQIAGMIGGFILQKRFDEAEHWRGVLSQRLAKDAMAGRFELSDPWFEWLNIVPRVIARCRELVDASSTQGNS
jgi:hypothetical protein